MPLYPSTQVSPAFSGDPTAPTPTAGDDDTSVATTEFVTDAVATQAATDAATYAALALATEGMTLTSYGDSYTTGSGAGAIPTGAFNYRVSQRLRTPTHNARGVSGAQLAGCINKANNTWTFGTGQIALVHIGLNDIRAGDSNGVTTLAEWSMGLPMLLKILTAGARYEQNDASFVFTGSGWGAHTNVSDGNASGGTYTYSTVQNDYFEWTVPAGVTEATLPVVGGYADIEWKKNGSVVATDTKVSTKATSNGIGYIRVPRTFTGLVQGDVIRGTMTSATGTFFADVAYIPSTTPPPIYLLLPGYLASYAAAPANGSDARMDAIAAATKTIAAGYPTVRCIDPNLLGWDKTTMICSDTVHPNDLGHSFLAGLCVTQILSDLTLSTAGLHT